MEYAWNLLGWRNSTWDFACGMGAMTLMPGLECLDLVRYSWNLKMVEAGNASR